MDDAILAIDLGGTHMRAALIDRGGGVHEKRIEPTPREASCPDALLTLAGTVLEGSGVTEAVVGVPGRIDHEAGHLEDAPNLPPGWPTELTEENLSSVLGIRARLANDADLATVGEARFGAGRGYRDIVYVTISTGVGAGVLLGGRLVHGRLSLAEVGHTVIDRGATARGEPATLEDLASGTALARIAREMGLDLDGAEIVKRVRDGDAPARRVWDGVADAAGIGVANLAHMFSPEVIIVGGGMSSAGDLLLDPIRAALVSVGPRGLSRPIAVVAAALGDDAGLAGAAAWSDALLGEAVGRV